MTKRPDTLERKIDLLTKVVTKGFNGVEKSMEAGFAAVAEDIAELKGDVTDIKSTMATKEQLFTLSLQVTGIEGELKSIRLDLDVLTAKAGHMPEYRKDIDLLYKKIEQIEKHLGIRKRTLA